MLNHRRFGRGRTVVLQHGFLGGGGYWAGVATALARHFDVVVPDLPGFAGSGALPARDSIAGFAEALWELLDGLGIEGPVSLVGHSMGGMIVQEAALARPGRLDRLVLYGTSATGAFPGRFETFEASLARLRDAGIDGTARHITATWFRDGEASPAFEACLAAGRGVTLEAALTALSAIPHWDARERLAGLPVPTLVIAGERDRSATLDVTLALYRALPDAQLCIVPDCAHNAHLERPDLFTPALATFLLGGGAQ